jgi:hypothetical protein
MSIPTLIAICVLAFMGFCSVCFVGVLLLASVIQHEVDEFRFRRELREAQREDERKPCRARERAHSRSHVEPALTRRGER